MKDDHFFWSVLISIACMKILICFTLSFLIFYLFVRLSKSSFLVFLCLLYFLITCWYMIILIRSHFSQMTPSDQPVVSSGLTVISLINLVLKRPNSILDLPWNFSQFSSLLGFFNNLTKYVNSIAFLLNNNFVI